MSNNVNDSGINTQYEQFKDDTTKPPRLDSDSISIPTYIITKMDSNISTMKDDVLGIKSKIEFDQHMVISDVAIGVISSFIVSIIILFVSTNIGVVCIKVLGMDLPIFVLFSVSLIIVGVTVHLITKKVILRKK
jgi:hypothetical protein